MNFIRPLSDDEPAIGGKARSLARLSALGLPTPAGFAISAMFARAMQTGGPAPPPRLRSVADVAALDTARAALVNARLPDDFQRELDDALQTLDPAGALDATFSVRSSAPNEDDADEAAPGIFDSNVRVRRADVATAVKDVLASALSPAAWTYALHLAAPAAEIAVLVHRFVDGTAQGAASCEQSAPGATSVFIDAQVGVPTATARVVIQDAAARASSRFGSVELEWVAQGDHVTFLQLRPFHPVRATDLGADQATEPSPRDDGEEESIVWSWDAAHNPTPLSPAQAGLVALVDECCPTGLRQAVRGGYLFYARAGGPPVPDSLPEARAAFERLAADVDARLNALGDEFRLEAALDLYVAAYTPLFGVVQPACSAARAALKAFVAHEVPEASRTGAQLLAGTTSAATRRATLAHAITHAPDSAHRQVAVDAYLHAFGDESPRWDVAEATLRETPERLLFLGAAAPEPVLSSPAAPESNAATAEAIATALADDVKRATFGALLAAAREAAAVGEDDDHLFARLQAAVRRALLVLGRSLAEAGRLRAVDDVFYLPLELVRALAEPALAKALVPALAATLDTLDLSVLSAKGRREFAAAASAPPALPRHRNTVDGIDGVVRGLSGSAGRAIGRAVHHPSSTPLGADAILIAVTLLPTELPLLMPAALVVETGSVLGHVAAQARERGIPAVVAAHGARAAIREGQLVIVDGARGQVSLIDED